MTNNVDTTAVPSIYRASTIESARDSAQKALLTAASRVLSYHAARLDAKVGRATQAMPDRQASIRKPAQDH